MAKKKPKLAITVSRSNPPSDADMIIDPESHRIWAKESVGRWLESGEGVAGTLLSQTKDIEGLLKRYDLAVDVVSKELGVDIKEIFGNWDKDRDWFRERPDELKRVVLDVIHGAINQDSEINSKRVFDTMHLYQSMQLTRHALKKNDAPSAAYNCALATEAAIKLKGRTAESMLASGYKFSVDAPAKKTGWHGPLIKAAKRELKTGTPERKIVGLMVEQFPSKSVSQIRRVLKKHGALK